MIVNRKVSILMYHYVRVLEDSRYPDIKGLELDLFYEQLGYLEKNYNFISIRQLIAAIEHGDTLPPKAVLLTFNDCYADHFNNVFPALDSKGIQGCFYPEVRAIVDERVLTNHKIHFVLAAAEDKSVVIDFIFSSLDELRSSFKLKANKEYFEKLAVASSYDSKEAVFIKRMLQTELPEEVSTAITDELFAQFVGVNEKAFSRELYLTEEQIKVMVKRGMHFGLLGYNHPRYDILSAEKQQWELQRAKDYLSGLGIIDSELTASYPWGRYNKDTLNILARLNCRAAFTTKSAVANLDLDAPLELPRLDTNEMPKQRDAVAGKWFQKA